jgi:hypothetical protein
MFSEILILQLLSLLTLTFFIATYNILTLWYLAGIYLICLGWLLLLDDGDLFVGFLWVIDLGVGLIFFIFILHYLSFLHQKAILDKSSREFCFIFLALFFLMALFYFFSTPIDWDTTSTFSLTWVFLISWYDFYDIFYSQTVTDLNLLREIYFYNNAFEFLIINFMLLYGIVASVLLSFLIKRIFTFLQYTQLVNYNLLEYANANFFIRNQNLLKQQGTSTGTRVWLKRKQTKF